MALTRTSFRRLVFPAAEKVARHGLAAAIRDARDGPGVASAVTMRADLQRLLPVVHDVIMAVVALFVALLLRYGVEEFPDASDVALSLSIFGAFAAIAFWVVGLRKGIWQFTSLSDLRVIVIAASITVVGFLIATFLVNRLEVMPRSVPLMAWFILIILLGAPRITYRIIKDNGVAGILRVLSGRSSAKPTRDGSILIVGSTTGADRVARALERVDTPVNAIGIVDINPRTEGLSIRGIPILGSVDQFEDILARLARSGRSPRAIVVASPREDQASLRKIAAVAATSGIQIKRVGDGGLASGEPANLQPVTLEDLLGRPPVSLDLGGMRRLIEDRCVLVTGAGGSIGSEIVRQVAALAPRRLILLDSSEFALYKIDAEISGAFSIDQVPVIASVRDKERIERLFAEEHPDVVFHAAALKHVPLVEANPCEGVLTNVAGSRCVADAAMRFGTRAMVMISSDKAVKPSSVMGATKRVAEAYCQALDVDRSGTRFITVRFGNVLGSTGSVVPRFEEQIRRGGPVTVTHPDMRRYFMTIREATELVLQAAAHGLSHPEEAGSIHVLDMGEPVKIIDLARTMIALAGLKPDEDIAVQVVGVRPGEKLYEEYFDPAEATRPSDAAGVFIASPRVLDRARLGQLLDELAEAAEVGDRSRMVALVRTLVPELPSDAGGVAVPATAVA